MLCLLLSDLQTTASNKANFHGEAVAQEICCSATLPGLGRDVLMSLKPGKGSGAQAVFSQILSVAWNDEGRNRNNQKINTWLPAWCHQQNFVGFDHGSLYMSPGLSVTDRISKGVFAQQFTVNNKHKANWKSFKLDFKGKEIKQGSPERSLEAACQCLSDDVLAKSFSLPSQWRQGMEIHAAAKTQVLVQWLASRLMMWGFGKKSVANDRIFSETMLWSTLFYIYRNLGTIVQENVCVPVSWESQSMSLCWTKPDKMIWEHSQHTQSAPQKH